LVGVIGRFEGPSGEIDEKWADSDCNLPILLSLEAACTPVAWPLPESASQFDTSFHE